MIISEVGSISMDEMVASMAEAKRDGLITWTFKDEVSLRERLKLPELDEKEFLEIQEKKAEMAKATQNPNSPNSPRKDGDSPEDNEDENPNKNGREKNDSKKKV